MTVALVDPWWEFFGGTAAPFPRNLPVDALFRAPSWQEAQARVLSVIADHGFGVLTGTSASAKPRRYAPWSNPSIPHNTASAIWR